MRPQKINRGESIDVASSITLLFNNKRNRGGMRQRARGTSDSDGVILLRLGKVTTGGAATTADPKRRGHACDGRDQTAYGYCDRLLP